MIGIWYDAWVDIVDGMDDLVWTPTILLPLLLFSVFYSIHVCSPPDASCGWGPRRTCGIGCVHPSTEDRTTLVLIPDEAAACGRDISDPHHPSQLLVS